jgi:dUTP pyrophosphatase
MTNSYIINLQLLENNKNLYNNSINKGNSKKDSGFDLFVPNDVTIAPGEIKLINMGIKCSVFKISQNQDTSPSPYYLYPRSSVSKRGIILVNSVGIIDSGYRGPLMAAFYNTKKEPVTIESGDRIVQICMPDLSYHFNVQLVESLDDTERGEGGLGSTGK